jgi:tetratricopeptide (TPR) repeat protein
MRQAIDSILQAMQQERHADALQLSRALFESFPTEEGVRSLLAASEQNAGDLHAARDLLQDLTRDHPGTWQHWNSLGNVRRLLGDFDAAGKAYAEALKLNAGSAKLHANLGLLHLNLGNFAEAQAQLGQACGMPGAEPGMRVWAAVAAQANADDTAAAAFIHGWQQWPPISEEALLELGWLLVLLGDIEGGNRILSSEFRDSNLRARGLARRVLAMERLNRMPEALDLAARMAEPSPIGDVQARLETLKALATIAARTRQHDKAREYFTQALSLEQPSRYRRPLYFSLAQACDALGDVDGAMTALAAAHANTDEVASANAEFSGTGLLSLIDITLAPGASGDWPTEDAPSAAESPVFIVGFPRSGTTLLEQILSAHPTLASVDEKPMVQRMLEFLREKGWNYPDALVELSVTDRAALRARYWEEAQRWVTRGANVRLVDKHPLNFLALPLIRFAFPNAPVIFCRRHPCDSILSSYLQDFRDPRLAAECVSLERLSKLFVRLAQRWQDDTREFPDHILICRHEDLIDDLDAALQRIGDFLGIEDVAPMRDYNANARSRGFIGTPSYAQVVQPINADAKDRWRRYADHLQASLPLLAPILDDWGYES